MRSICSRRLDPEKTELGFDDNMYNRLDICSSLSYFVNALAKLRLEISISRR